MSAHQITLKPIGDVAKYLKNLIPADIPGYYALKPRFNGVADEAKIRSGVVAFRDFLFCLFDRLCTDGHIYAKPPKTPNGAKDYPLLHNMTNLLVDMGYYGELAPNGDFLRITRIPLCSTVIDELGNKKSSKISASGFIESIRFLSLCGFEFSGIDMNTKAVSVSETQPLTISYPGNPVLATGLKALSIADMELRTESRYWNDNNLLRCDYRLLKANDTDIFDELKDFLHPLPIEVQDFAKELHRRYTGMGLTCTSSIHGDASFSYANLTKSRKELTSREKYQQRIWMFNYSLMYGYGLLVRAKKTDKHADVIGNFAPPLQKKIKAGYGCYRKFGRKRCTGDCQGIRIPLNDSILPLGKDIKTWLDLETT